MMKKSFKSIRARAVAEVFGAYPESLVNSAAAKGIMIRNVQRLNANTLRFEVLEKDGELLRELAKNASLELKITGQRDEGRRVLKKRFALLPLLGLVGLLFFTSSLFIWQIDVYGLNSLSRGQLLSALEDSGLGMGTFWPKLKADDIRSRVMLQLPEIGWMSVNISGSRAVVLVNERVEKPEIYIESQAADLVADKTGLVRRVSVLSGDACVEPSQAVTAGETLASGRLTSIMGQQRTVRARGTVMADTWYEIDAVCPLETELKTQGMLKRHRFALVLGKRRINLYFSSGKAIDECDKIIKEYTMGLDGHFALPIRFVHECIVACDLRPGEAYNRDEMAAHLAALLQRETEGQILQSVFTESFADGLYILTLRAHCLENISVTRELEG